MTDYLLSPVELYMKKSLRLLVLLITLCAFCACGTFTVLTILGFYPDVSLVALIAFDLFDLTCFFIGRILSRRIITKDGVFHENYIFYAKLFVFLLIVIQWNFILYMIPSRDFWAYACFFVLFSVFYVDHRFTFATEAGVGISLGIAWMIKEDALTPIKDQYFIPEMVLRVVLIVLFFIFLWFVSFFTQTMLVKPMETLADFDTLTGIRNRRTMYRLIEDAIRKNREQGKSVTILLCDIDNFKSKNDTYGHDCGDLVLKRVAETMVDSLGDNGIVFRYGGEEFVVMIDARHMAAVDIAEHIRQAVEDNTVYFDGQEVKVTITVGAVDSEGYRSVDDLISIADERMYKGKLSGKNKVIYSDEIQ